jgi:RNA polymerase sigma factor (sigma-70 family)
LGGRRAVLTKDEEARLAVAMAAGREAAAILSTGEPESVEEREALVTAVATGRGARAQFIEANIGLVYLAAGRFPVAGIDHDDLVQDGMIGLITAVEKFDWTKGFKFSTYAMWWIRQAMQRSDAMAAATGVLSQDAQLSLKQIHIAREELTGLLGRSPTTEEIAIETGFSPARVRELSLFSKPVLSLDQAVNSDDGATTTLGDTLADRLGRDVAEEAADAVEREQVVGLLDELGSLEREVLVARYGLNGGEPIGPTATAARLGTSVRQVRRMEREALDQLRASEQTARLVAV